MIKYTCLPRIRMLGGHGTGLMRSTYPDNVLFFSLPWLNYNCHKTLLGSEARWLGRRS